MLNKYEEIGRKNILLSQKVIKYDDYNYKYMKIKF